MGVLKRTVLLGGACEVGKTQMAHWFCRGKAAATYTPSDDRRWEKGYELSEGARLELTLLDTGGHSDYDDFLEDWLEDADAYMFIFSLDDQNSTKKLTLFKDSLPKLENGSKHHITLVGNSPSGQPEKRVVSEEKGRSYAKDFGPDCVYVETTTRETAKGVHPKASVQAAFDAAVGLMFPGQTKACQVKGAPDSLSSVLDLITSLQDELKRERTERVKDQERFVAVLDTERAERLKDQERCVALEETFAATLDARLKDQEVKFNQQLASIMASVAQLGLDKRENNSTDPDAPVQQLLSGPKGNDSQQTTPPATKVSMFRALRGRKKLF